MDSVELEEFMKLMDKTTYHHPARNPPSREPEEGLRILITRVGERAARIPIKARQALMEVGFHKVHSWATSLGTTQAEVRATLEALNARKR